jgi:hypothetical protein
MKFDDYPEMIRKGSVMFRHSDVNLSHLMHAQFAAEKGFCYFLLTNKPNGTESHGIC